MSIKKKNEILGFIPARAGSKRIKNKNIRFFKRKPLIYHTIKSSLKSKYITKTVVFSDSQKFNKISSKIGADINFKRPKFISKDKTTMYETIKYFFNKYKIQKKFQFFVLLQPTSPLRNENDIDKAILQLVKKKNADGIISTFKVNKIKKSYPDKFMNEKKGFLKIIKKKNITKLDKVYLRNGPAIFIIKTERLQKELYNLNLLNYVMSENRSLDINNEGDLNF